MPWNCDGTLDEEPIQELILELEAQAEATPSWDARHAYDYAIGAVRRWLL